MNDLTFCPLSTSHRHPLSPNFQPTEIAHCFWRDVLAAKHWQRGIKYLSVRLQWLVFSLFLANAAFADELDLDPRDLDFRNKVFAHEQCASECQIEFDDLLAKCLPYRRDTELAVEAECPDRATEQLEHCKERCPPDPRRPPDVGPRN